MLLKTECILLGCSIDDKESSIFTTEDVSYLNVDGSVIGFNYRATYYPIDVYDSFLYGKNLQGDIVAIYTTSGRKGVWYKYDAWGNVIDQGCAENLEYILNTNPFKYRGYYHDAETGLYYLQSRYYDPATGRFINADDISYLGADDELTGYNLYSYCGNNPVMYVDESGHSVLVSMLIAGLIGAGIAGFFNAIGQAIEGQPWNWESFGLSLAGGFVSGALSALPLPKVFTSWGLSGKIMGYGLTFLYGGSGAVLGGLITGSVNDWGSAGLTFLLGGTANVIGKGISDKIASVKANRIFNQGSKAKSLAVQQLQSSRFNMGHQALKSGLRNAFKQTSQAEIITLITNANMLLRNGIYSAVVSSTLSGWY